MRDSNRIPTPKVNTQSAEPKYVSDIESEPQTQSSDSLTTYTPVPFLPTALPRSTTLLALQRTIGNHAIESILHDNVQREAEQMTGTVMPFAPKLSIQRREVCDDEGVCRSEPDVEPNSSQQNYVEAPPPEQNYVEAPPPEQNDMPAPSPEQGHQAVPKFIDPNAQRLANGIEEMGGECYDVTKVSYSKLFAEYNELVAQRLNAGLDGKPPEVSESTPEQMIEGRNIYYLDETSGIQRVRSKYVRGTKAQLDELEEAERQKIAQAQLSGILQGASKAKGRIPSPGQQEWREPEDTQSTRSPYVQEPF